MPSRIYKRRKDIKERFEEKIKFSSVDLCWKWIPHSLGFRVDGETIRPSRFAYKLYIGSIPNKLYVCHTCDNPRCCNPNHFFLGTQQDNMNDMKNKGRQADKNGNKNPFYGKQHSKETIRILSEKAKLRIHTEETKIKIAQKMKGRIVTEEHRSKIGVALKGKSKSEKAKQNMKAAWVKRKIRIL